MKNKKAQFAEIDFFLAILLLGLGLVVITAPFIHVREDIQADRLSYDAVNMLSTLKFGDLDSGFKNDISSNLTEFNISYSSDDTLTSIITKLLVKSEEINNNDILEFARYVINTALEDVIPPRYKFEVSIQSGDTWYDIINISESDKTDIASQSRTMLTGLEVQMPMTGFISSAFISEAKKVDSEYFFIGGFIGQGNLSFKMDIDSDEINNFYLEGLFYDNFSVFVNNDICAFNVGSGFVNQTFDDCVSRVNNGENIINISFLGDDLSKKYISGGSIRIDYNITESVSKSDFLVKGRKYIAGVDGVINIYDSFYVPGKLEHVNFRLNHDINITWQDEDGFEGDDDNDAKLIMTIANKTVYETYVKGPISFENSGVYVGDYVNATIPFRIGFEEFSAVIQDSSAVDVVLVTDLSGSMDWWTSNTNNCPNGICSVLLEEGFGSDFSINITNSCPGINESDFSRSYLRIDVARCLNLEFINRTFNNVPDARIGMVGYAWNVTEENYIDLKTSDDFDVLWNYASTMSASGNTCSSCGVAAANYMLNNSFEADRKRVIVFMTDGVANRCFRRRAPSDFGDSPDFGGDIPPAGGGSCSGVTAPIHFLEWANYSKYGSLEVDFYSIGFRVPNLSIYSDPLIEASTTGSEDGGYYYSGEDGTSLSDIYLSISDAIAISAGYVDQVINVTLDDFDVFKSVLKDSYIEYEYVPYEDPDLAGTIKLTLEQSFNSDNCFQTFSGVDYGDARVKVGSGFLTSYSGNIWTSRALINNNLIFNIFDYSPTLGTLGDPFVLGIRTSLLNTIQNNVTIELHDGGVVADYCDPNNKLIYNVHFPAFFSSDGVHEISEGCTWDVAGVVNDIFIPHDYSGPNSCTFDPHDFYSATFDDKDSLQVLGYNILRGLTYNDELIIDLDKSSIDVSVLQIDDVPYLWGPALLGVTIWR